MPVLPGLKHACVTPVCGVSSANLRAKNKIANFALPLVQLHARVLGPAIIVQFYAARLRRHDIQRRRASRGDSHAPFRRGGNYFREDVLEELRQQTRSETIGADLELVATVIYLCFLWPET